MALNRPITKPQKCDFWIAARVVSAGPRSVTVAILGVKQRLFVPRYAFECKGGHARPSLKIKGLTLFHVMLTFRDLDFFTVMTTEQVREHLKPPVAKKQTRVCSNNKAA